MRQYIHCRADTTFYQNSRILQNLRLFDDLSNFYFLSGFDCIKLGNNNFASARNCQRISVDKI